MIKTINKIEEVIDFAWELSQNDLYASYHRIKSMEKLREDFERALVRDNESIIACYQENVLCGVCIYFWQCDEKYSQTTQFLIRGDYDKTAEELIAHIGRQLPGHELYIGVPFSNKDANQYFKKNNFECIESSIDTRIYNLKAQMNEKHEQVEEITISNFEEYAIFHDKYAIPSEMYYNSENLIKDIERFKILIFKKDGAIRASIFAKKVRNTGEIFGLFVDEQYKNSGIEGILINEMLMQLYNKFGSLEEVVYFIDEDSPDELNSALAAGFQINDKYRCYKCIL